jgi:hypothetical protein
MPPCFPPVSIFATSKNSVCMRLLLCLILLGNAACKQQKPDEILPKEKGTYFSIVDFTKDQYQTMSGQPFVIIQTSQFNNGTADSTWTDSYKMDWSNVFKIFFAADISAPKFLGHYTFAVFDNPTLAMTLKCYNYEASEPELFTRKLQINTDPLNNRIISLYIETEKSSTWNRQSQKLFYMVNKFIQIQQYKKPLIGRAKNLITQYTFMK